VFVRRLWLSTVTVLSSPMSHSCSDSCSDAYVTLTLDSPLGVASAAPTASGSLLLNAASLLTV